MSESEDLGMDCAGTLLVLGEEIDDTEPEVSLLSTSVAVAGLQLVSRSAWGARPPKAMSTHLASTSGTKVHYTGGTVDPRMLTDHRRCAPAVRAIQRMHMDDNGWNDIAYTAVICPHRYVFIGRGPHVLPASNGPGLNSGHYGVCALVGNKGVVTPVDGHLHGLRDAIEWLREKGAAGGQIKGHRDGYSTDCPGDPLYAWVRKGAPRPGGSSAPPPKPVPSPPFPLPAGHWFGPESSDPHNHSGFYAKDRPPIKDLQQRLKTRGWSITVTGRYDKQTVEVITKFQRDKHLTPDGLCGPKTWKAAWSSPITT